MEKEILFQDIPLDDYVLIDVRSPVEFNEGHVSGAFNVPLFSNEERADIGTLYKQIGKDEAIKKGLEFVGPKMSRFVDEVKAISQGKDIYVYCFRGGMRSESFVWLLNTANVKATKIIGGYKQIRKQIRESFSKNAPIVILGGMTGSGKTRYLRKLNECGIQTLDLEKLANHKGSAFGHINEEPQPTNEQYENNLYDEWKRFDFSKIIVIEDESLKVGNVHVPQPLYLQMQAAPVICIEVPMKERVRQLKEDYLGTDKNLLIRACDSIKNKLGGKEYKEIVNYIQTNDIESACEKLLNYYDKMYLYGIEKRMPGQVVKLQLTSETIEENVKNLKNLILVHTTPKIIQSQNI